MTRRIITATLLLALGYAAGVAGPAVHAADSGERIVQELARIRQELAGIRQAMGSGEGRERSIAGHRSRRAD